MKIKTFDEFLNDLNKYKCSWKNIPLIYLDEIVYDVYVKKDGENILEFQCVSFNPQNIEFEKIDLYYVLNKLYKIETYKIDYIAKEITLY